MLQGLVGERAFVLMRLMILTSASPIRNAAQYTDIQAVEQI